MAPKGSLTPSVSVLKPVRGVSPGFYEAAFSNASQNYPGFELLFGVADPADPAVEVIQSLARQFRNVRLIRTQTRAPNGKAGSLIDLAREARGAVLVASDADIRVPDDYLRRVVAPLADPRIGLVTCVYRARSDGWPGRFEALGVATDFAPGAIVAPYAGVSGFALGSTMAFRAADLARIGGFESVSNYLADDYQLGHRIHQLGLKCVLSDVVVVTHLAGESWPSAWRHQVRWARTVRVSRFGGYAGLPVTFATLWALLAMTLGHPWMALMVMGARIVMALIAGGWALESRDAIRLAWLIPVRDLFGVAVWVAGLFGNSVEWGGERLELERDGRIRSSVIK